MSTGFGTAAQQRSYVLGCLADGASAESLAWHLGTDAETVRRIASEAGSSAPSEVDGDAAP